MAPCMGTSFKYDSYDFSNNLNMPESQHQERRLEALVAKGWEIEATVLTDVYLSVLWRRDGEAPPDADEVAELEAAASQAHEFHRQAEEARANLQQVTAERDQAREALRQLQAREASAPASVESGDVPLP